MMGEATTVTMPAWMSSARQASGPRPNLLDGDPLRLEHEVGQQVAQHEPRQDQRRALMPASAGTRR